MRWFTRLWRSALSALLVAAAPAVAAPDPAVVHANAARVGGAEYEEGWFGSGDERLHYVAAGSGPLIVFYHGFPSFWFSWFDQMEALKGRYRVVAVDGLGAGLSAKPADPSAYRIDRLAAQLDGLARHLAGKERFVLVGHDWGAALAFAYAQAYPRRLKAVVGMSAPPYNLFLDLVSRNPAQQARSGYMQRFRTMTLPAITAGDIADRIARQSYEDLVTKGAITPAEAALFRATLSDPVTIDGGMNWYRANIPSFDRIDASTRWPRKPARIAVPALLIWGDADQTFVPDFLDRMPEHASNLTIERLPGVGHWTPMERPDLTNPVLERFLARARGRP